jgi:hypothetical protein
VQDLSSYSLEVIAPVLDEIGKENPKDFKQLWPAVGTILDAIRGHIRANRPSAEQEAANRWLQYIDKCKEQGVERPDEETQTRIATLNEKFGLERPKEIETTCTELVCPGCGLAQPVAGNIRNWTPDQLREHADVLEELALIADRNRNMPPLPLGEVIEEAVSE